jgi:hypothetical protein
MFRNAKMAYSSSLVLGALGFISAYFVHDQYLLFVSFLLIGCAWAAMLALPFALLTNALTGKSLGSYMGLFNGTICLPQIVASLAGMAIMGFVGTEVFVNELDYPNSPKVENCSLVATNEDGTQTEMIMHYEDENNRYVADSISTSAISGKNKFRLVANNGNEEYAIKYSAANSTITANEAFGLARKTDDVKIKDIHVAKFDDDGAEIAMSELTTAYFYPGCDRLFMMESDKEFVESEVMPKATKGQITMLLIAGGALFLGALAVFGINTRRKE